MTAEAEASTTATSQTGQGGKGPTAAKTATPIMQSVDPTAERQDDHMVAAALRRAAPRSARRANGLCIKETGRQMILAQLRR